MDDIDANAAPAVQEGPAGEAAQPNTAASLDPNEMVLPAVVAEALSRPNFATIVEQWWADHFPGSAVARSTEAWNTAHAAKEKLKAILAAL